MIELKHSLSILYVAVFLLALNGLFAKLIPLDATSITQLRSVLAAMTLFLFAIIRNRQAKLDSLSQYSGIYMIGLIMGLHWISFFYSMQVSTVAIGMLSLFTYPIISVFLEPFFTKQKILRADIVAGVIVLVGVFLMLSDDLHSFSSSSVQGVFWGVVSAFLFSLRNLLQKYHYAEVSSDRLMLHQVIAISFMLLYFIDYPQVATLSSESWIMLVLLGVVSTAAGHTLLTYSLKHFPVKTIAMISCMQPLFATLFAWALLSEVPTISVFAGGLVIVSVAIYETIQKSAATRKRVN